MTSSLVLTPNLRLPASGDHCGTRSSASSLTATVNIMSRRLTHTNIRTRGTQRRGVHAPRARHAHASVENKRRSQARATSRGDTRASTDTRADTYEDTTPTQRVSTRARGVGVPHPRYTAYEAHSSPNPAWDFSPILRKVKR